MGTASGPYAPAGTLPPNTTSTPLIPFGSLNGATRVPPPPTGSTQAAAPYNAAGPAAGSVSANTAFPNTFASDNGFANQTAAAPAIRQTLGGMPVIDLTAGFSGASTQPAAFNAPNNTAPIGSGVASVNTGWQATGTDQAGMAPQAIGNPQIPQSISVNPTDLASRLRPLDPQSTAGAIPVQAPPGYTPAQPPYVPAPFSPVQQPQSVAMTQYRTESPATNAAQPPTAAAGIPSTEPVKPASATTNDSLLWRNPTSAR
jgi:hypothetical protein